MCCVGTEEYMEQVGIEEYEWAFPETQLTEEELEDMERAYATQG